MFSRSQDAAAAALRWRQAQHQAQARLAELRGQDRAQLRTLGLAGADLEQTPRWRLARRAGLRGEMSAANQARGELAGEIADWEDADRKAGSLADQAEAVADLLARAERDEARAGRTVGSTALGWVRRAVPGKRPVSESVDGQDTGRARWPDARRSIGTGRAGPAALPPGAHERGPEPRL